MMDEPLVIRVNYKKIILITIQKRFFCQAYFFIFSLIKTAFLSSILSMKNAKN